MENNFMLTDDLLWDYADGLLEGDEQIRVASYLGQHPEYQARLDAILSEKRAFSALRMEKPNAGFAQQVMAAWATEQVPAKALDLAKPKGRDWILWGIAAAFGLMMLAPLWMAPAAAPAFQIPDAYIPQIQVPTFDWAGFFSSAWLRNLVLLTTAFMALKLLDKYLQVRNMRLSGH